MIMGLKLGSEKYSNYEYAPGIATYGVDGSDGESGKNGTSVFVCQYDLTTDSGITNFDNAILQNLVMSQNSSSKVGRDYINGDCFLFPDGNIYKVIDIVNLRDKAAQNQLTDDNYTDYMDLVGSITISDTTVGFSTSVDRLILDTNAYKGFVINVAEADDTTLEDIEAPFSIISNDSDNDNKIYFIKLKSIYTTATESDLDIYYDGNNNAYHIESDRPILFSGDVQISDNTDDDYDEYSKILTTDNSITSFHGICNNLTYSTSSSSYTETDSDGNVIDYTSLILTIINSNDVVYDDLKNITIHLVCIKDNKICKEIFDIESINELINNQFTYTLTGNYTSSDYKWRLSIIKTIEVYIASNE